MSKSKDFLKNVEKMPGYKKMELMSPSLGSKIAFLVGIIWLLAGGLYLTIDSSFLDAKIMVVAGFGWLGVSYGMKKLAQVFYAKEKTYNLMLLFNKKMENFQTNEDKMLVDFMWCLFHYDSGTRKLKLKWRSNTRVAYNGTASLAAQRALEDIKNSTLKKQDLEPQDLTEMEAEQFSLVIDRLVLKK